MGRLVERVDGLDGAGGHAGAAIDALVGMNIEHPGRLERRFVRDEAADRVHKRLLALAPQAAREGSTHPDVLAALGALYADTVSKLRPRVMVQGNPHYLGQAGVVAEIRAVLLAALRSAVLWRQLGGSLWDFMLRRRQMLEAIQRNL